MPDLLGFPKVGIWGNVQEPVLGALGAGEPSSPPSPAAGTWGSGSPDPATSLVQERTGEQSHGSCQDWQNIG